MFLKSNLIYLRMGIGYSQRGLAESLDLKRSRIGGWEEGRNEPSIEHLILVSDFFKITIDTLLKIDLAKKDSDPIIQTSPTTKTIERSPIKIIYSEDEETVGELKKHDHTENFVTYKRIPILITTNE